MWYDIAPLSELTEAFRRLPGIGGKSARRLAFHILGMPKDEAKKLALTIQGAVDGICRCKICCNISDSEICPICRSESRDKSVICVVQGPQDMIAVERTGEFNGLYHVLNGVLSPVGDVKPSDLKIRELLERLGSGEVEEIILATPATAEGEVTAVYLSNLLKPLGVKTTRLANGIPVGSELEFTDEVTILRALENRSEL